MIRGRAKVTAEQIPSVPTELAVILMLIVDPGLLLDREGERDKERERERESERERGEREIGREK